MCRIGGVGNHIARQRADALAPHGVALVGHRGRTDLFFLERLFDLFKGLEQTQVVRELVCRLRETGEAGEEVGVHLARIGLSRNGDATGKIHLPRDHVLERLHFALVPLEQLHERRLRAGRPLGAEEQELSEPVLERLHVLYKLVNPEGRALADRRQLGGLQMRVGEARQVAPLFRESAELPHDLCGFFQNQARRVAQHDHIGVVPHIAGGRPEVNDRLRLRALYPVSVDMAHDVMAYLALPRLRHVEIDVVAMRLELRHLLFGDGESERVLRPRQSDPQPPPRAELVRIRKQILHLLARIPRRKRRNILLACRLPVHVCLRSPCLPASRRKIFFPFILTHSPPTYNPRRARFPSFFAPDTEKHSSLFSFPSPAGFPLSPFTPKSTTPPRCRLSRRTLLRQKPG